VRRSPPGARSLRLHPYDTRGRETLDAEPCAATLQAVRAACPGVQVSLSTSSAIEADSERRLALIADWTELPDLVTANQGEAGIAELCRLLRHRGVGIEAGLLSVQDARAFVAADLAAPCVRAMIQPLDPDPNAATDHADAIERVLHDAGVQLPQIHTETASPPGPSTAGRSAADTASAPASKTPQCSPTVVSPPPTANSSRPPRHCSSDSIPPRLVGSRSAYETSVSAG